MCDEEKYFQLEIMGTRFKFLSYRLKLGVKNAFLEKVLF